MTETPKTVFVAKWALEHGIQELDVLDREGSRVLVRFGSDRVWLPPGAWHATREAAVTRANAMRDTKLASLHQQAERMMGLRF